ncbi:hypothetical protein HNQ38_000681 [Desulfovibrio intestinalis]|uniref:Uncharacterized protein n=1 Tax=Desulfovibrio intestinalis TaxID=58621 RepID=A0A7W8C198_9BACT|nr:hypothetical protein [Desulfovibrio intestinalis]
MTRIPQNAKANATHRSGPRLSLKKSCANSAVIMGDVEMITQLVVGFSEADPILKTSMYKAKPVAPDTANQGKDVRPGKGFLLTARTAPRHSEATPQRSKAKEAKEKLPSAIFVKT